MEQRMKLIEAWKSRVYSNVELFEHFGISRKTGYKWIGRYEEEGVEGLRDRSRAPHRCPHRTAEDAEEAIVALRQKRPRWGPKKIIQVLKGRHPEVEWPAPSTAGEMLARRGMVKTRRRKQGRGKPTTKLTDPRSSNDVWTLDFKGQFRLGSGRLCYPVTMSDLFSRYLLLCDGKPSTAMAPAQMSIERVFRDAGLPQVIRTDNGEPFASHGLCGLNRLNVWWMKLEIRPERIQRGRPQQNGAHERMHRDLKADTARPPAATEQLQQQRFDAFQAIWNHERPHEALGQRPPALLWEPSPRPFPERLPEPHYPGHWEVRTVRQGGEIKFKNHMIFLSQALAHEQVALEEVDDGVWSVMFFSFEVGRLEERTWVIYG
jgi:transposase InsO family protein